MFLVVALSGVLGVAGYIGYEVYAERQARERAMAVFSQHDSAIRKWDVAMGIATRTPRIALAGPVRELAEIEESVRNLAADGCAARASKALAASMQFPRDAMMEFMASNAAADMILVSAMRIASDARNNYDKMRAACLKSPRD